MAASLARQSFTTRYRRFLTDKRSFTDLELRYLTEVDGVHHLALVGVQLDERGCEQEGVCSARYVELHDEPGVAEPALVVADAFQGLGIGAMMFSRLVDCARARGIRRFHCELLGDNYKMLRILERVAPVSERWREGSVLVVRFDLD